ncbi:cardioacceleratory peptide receptor-like [Limulus polyphemus]|uniref:Cardioacceleratory peptide receptor-like n=1 Tax=Limulus polyphemus TaxID=6850 RepID=A0ABM1BWH7_LIMPO|nr:cardioacceleratory peptide receptor-like [Limulus polyphemus]
MDLESGANSPRIRNRYDKYLCFPDLAVGLFSVLTDIVWRTTVEFHIGNIGCKIVKYLQFLVTYSSTYVLVALSIDRYDAIIHPMKFSGGWKRARVLVVSAWGLSALASTPALFFYNEAKKGDKLQCWIEFQHWEWQLYFTLVSVSVFFLPALIISLCYTVIVCTIWKKSRPIKSSKGRKRATQSLSVRTGPNVDP